MPLRFKFDLNRYLYCDLKQRLEFSMQFGLALVAPQGHSERIRLLCSVIIPSVDVPDDQEHGAIRRIESVMKDLAA